MKKLAINITKAQLVSFRVELKETKPVINATIGLYTDGGKKITDYSIYSDGWSDDNKFDIPVEVLPLIGDTMRILEKVVVKHCRDGQKSLPAIIKEQPVEHAPVIIDDVVEADMPINLESIPF